MLPAATARHGALSREVLATYRSFYPTVASRRAIRRWPQMLPLDPGEPAYATLADIEFQLPKLGVPLLWLYATPGAITTPARLEWLRRSVATAELRSVGQGGHYLPEEVPEAIAAALDDWLPRVLGSHKPGSCPPAIPVDIAGAPTPGGASRARSRRVGRRLERRRSTGAAGGWPSLPWRSSCERSGSVRVSVRRSSTTHLGGNQHDRARR